MPRPKSEIGAVGLPIFSGYVSLDPNTRLRGSAAARVYRDMIQDEPACGAFVGACNTLLRTDLQVETGGSTDNDKRAGEHLEQCLDDMRDSKSTNMRQAYSVIPMGWSLQEIVWKRRNGGVNSKYTDGKIGYADWAMRRQESLYRWTNDANGRVSAFNQRPAPSYSLREIPLNKCLHIVADDTEGSPEGRSAIRGMYQQAYYVKNFQLLLGIAMERFGTGIPVFKQTTEVEVTQEHLDQFDAIAVGLRQNEEAYIRVPFGYDFTFAPSPGLDANTYLEAITRFRTWALSTVLAEFIALGIGTAGGSRALGGAKIDLFLKALTGYQERVCEAINRQAVRRLFQYNDFGTLTDLPRVTLPAVREYDLQALGSFAQVLEGIGAFHPTAADESMFRKIADFVNVDMKALEDLHEADDVAAAQVAQDAASAAPSPTPDPNAPDGVPDVQQGTDTMTEDDPTQEVVK